MAFSIYIYYKVAAEDAGRVRPVAEELQRSLAALTGIQGSLQCRRDKPETWMEVYEGVVDADAFLAVMDAQLQRLRFAELLGADARRMTELFRPL